MTHLNFEPIHTPRLELIPATPESLLIQKADAFDMRAQLGQILNAEVPPSWPHEHWEPHVYDYMLDLIAQDPEAKGWCRYILLRQDSHRTLIGTCGSGFPKPDTGLAEIGYGLLTEFQRQGFAAEAMEALLPWLQTRRQITAFVAQTFPNLYGSIRVLQKLGFTPSGAGYEEGAILFRKECETILVSENP